MRPPAPPRAATTPRPAPSRSTEAQASPAEPSERTETTSRAVEPASAGRTGSEDGLAPVNLRLRERVAEQRAARRRLGWRRALLAVLAAAAAAGLVWLVYFSSVLALRPEQVRVSGAGLFVDAEQVAEHGRAWADTPLARVDVGQVHEQVAALAPVASVDVRRAWPHGLSILVQERTALATAIVGAERLVLDVEGVRLALVSEQDWLAAQEQLAGQEAGEDAVDAEQLDAPETTIDATTLVGLPVVELSGSSEIDGPVLAALEVIDSLPPDVLALVERVSAASANAVRLHLVDGVTVEWGSPLEAELKAAVLGALLQVEAAVYDVSAPAAPITRDEP